MGLRAKPIALLNEATYLLDERRLVNALLDFCNGSHIVFVNVNGGPVGSPTPPNAFDDLRATIAARLELAVTDLDLFASSFIPDAAMLLIDGRHSPRTLRRHRSGYSLGHRVDFESPEEALNYALLLLLDVSKPNEKAPYGQGISRCRLESCARFYLATKNPKGGPANRHYCTPKHRDIAHNSQNRSTRKRA